MNIKEFLDEHVEKINTEAFIDDDPVRFPRRYNDLRDIEIVAFTVANIAWGKRSMILRDAERMLAKMGTSPFDFVMNEGYKTLGTANVHRTFFEHNLAYMMRGFKALYADYKSIDECFTSLPEDKRNAWTLVETLNGYAMQANAQQTDIRCYSRNAVKSALKRVNLALRWLVRTDGIVDIGVWKSLKPCDLYIPLDVHVGNTARALGLLTRSSNDRRAVEELTAKLREFNPSDPIIYDFALFGVGVTQQSFKI